MKKPQYTTQLFGQLLATTVGENQAETPIHSARHLIVSCQREEYEAAIDH